MQVLNLERRAQTNRKSEGVTVYRERKNGLILEMYRRNGKYLSVFLDQILAENGIKELSREALKKELKKLGKEVTA